MGGRNENNGLIHANIERVVDGVSFGRSKFDVCSVCVCVF